MNEILWYVKSDVHAQSVPLHCLVCLLTSGIDHCGVVKRINELACRVYRVCR
jgi:hypothetical protein